jgi:hypothetical protein
LKAGEVLIGREDRLLRQGRDGETWRSDDELGVTTRAYPDSTGANARISTAFWEEGRDTILETNERKSVEGEKW